MYDKCQEWLRENLPDEFEQCKFIWNIVEQDFTTQTSMIVFLVAVIVIKCVSDL